MTEKRSKFFGALFKKLLAFLAGSLIPVGEFFLIQSKSLFGISLRLQNFALYGVGIVSDYRIVAAFQNPVADAVQLGFVFPYESIVIVGAATDDIPHINQHDTVIIRIVRVCGCRQFFAEIVLIVLSCLGVVSDEFCYLQFHLTGIVVHQIINGSLKIESKLREKRNVRHCFSPLPFADGNRRDI